jgi:UDP-N-acetylmuramyl pentapeptide phosphotransferase/UDP-N-acetylglucosamine-1-phosphate transferase
MFGFLGLVDDLLGDARDRGLRGHVGAALHGRVTTGFVKLGGGVAVALVLAGAIDGDRPGRVLVDAALISLAANLGNLLDRAPGRTAKWGLLAYIGLAVVAGSAAAGVALAVVAGAAAALLVGDLRERFMLGDTGANALGAALGVGAVLVVSPGARTAIAAVLLGLTLLSEVASFSRIIERVPPLRAFDRLGRLPKEGTA